MRRPPSSVLLAASVALGALVLARCSFGINPDEGYFACLTVADCTSGQDCVPNPDGGNGLCYPVGACLPGVVPCGAGQGCVDGGCVDCTGCAVAACAGASCVLDGGPQQCVSRVVLPDGGLEDAGLGMPLPDGGFSDAGVGATTYVCDFP